MGSERQLCGFPIPPDYSIIPVFRSSILVGRGRRAERLTASLQTGWIVQNKANWRRRPLLLTGVEKGTYERSRRILSLRKQSQFGALRLLRRRAPRNDMRAQGPTAWASPRRWLRGEHAKQSQFSGAARGVKSKYAKGLSGECTERAAAKTKPIPCGTHPETPYGVTTSAEMPYGVTTSGGGGDLWGDSGILGGRMVGKREPLGLEIERCCVE